MSTMSFARSGPPVMPEASFNSMRRCRPTNFTPPNTTSGDTVYTSDVDDLERIRAGIAGFAHVQITRA